MLYILIFLLRADVAHGVIYNCVKMMSWHVGLAL